MHLFSLQFRRLFCLLSLMVFSHSSWASHIVGAEMNYAYLGNNNYRVTLTIYQDCTQGDPQAISEDNPAFMGIFTGANFSQNFFYPAGYDSVAAQSITPVNLVIDAPCTINNSNLCFQRIVFSKVYNLPPTNYPYLIVYQRCCRDANVVNISTSNSVGETFYCTIPAANTIPVDNSPVFTNYPPEVLLINYPLVFNNSATDADGDSLSYSFSTPDIGGSDQDAKPVPSPPPYGSVTYQYPYTAANPIAGSPAFQIDPVTGIITGTPNVIGRYLMSVNCDEWRNGTKIGTTTRDFQFVVTNANQAMIYHPFAGNDTTVVVGDTVHFQATGATQYSWTPATYLSDTSISNPIGIYPSPGTFDYVLTGIDSATGCTGNDTIDINVVRGLSVHIPTAFTPNNDGINDYFYPMRDNIISISSFKIYDKNGMLVADCPRGYWDGTSRGVKQDMGAYLWSMEYIDKKGKHQKADGWVTLIR